MMMTSTELAYAEKRMQQKWYDLVMAEQNGNSVQVLERLYTSYVLAVEVYNRCLEEEQASQQTQPIPVSVKPKRNTKKAS